MTRKVCLLILTLSFFTPIISAFSDDELPHFSATCKDKQAVAYRYYTDMDGKTSTDEWSKGEKFNSEFKFQYAGGNDIIVDGKRLPIAAKSGPCLAVSEPTVAPMGAGIWIFAINVKLQTIVAAQVNASYGFLEGVKTRSVCFDCIFDFQD